jgi:hypothetical protein
MATIVNLNLGGSGGPTVIAVDLVLTNGYTEPDPRLLILRSRPDVEPIAGVWSTTESGDAGNFDAHAAGLIDPVTGTLFVTGRRDTAAFSGASQAGLITGSFTVTDRKDAAALSGEGFIGIGQRRGTLASVERGDTVSMTAVYDPRWVAELAVDEDTDQGQFSGAFLEYVGPGFLVANERPDSVGFIGRITYDVSGTLAATEATDVGVIEVRAGLQLEAESTDTVRALDLLEGEVETVSLVDRVRVLDTLDSAPYLNASDRVRGLDTVVSNLRVSIFLTEQVRCTDTLEAVYEASLADTVRAQDVSQVIYAGDVSEQANVADTIASQILLDGTLTETVQSSDSAGVLYQKASTENVRVIDTLTDGGVVYQAALTDEGVAAEEWISTLSISVETVESVGATDALDSSLFAESTDTVQVADTLSGDSLVLSALEDSALVVDSLLGEVMVYAPALVDTVQAVETLGGALALVGILSDAVWAVDSLNEAIAQTLCVINAETGAASTYQMTPLVAGLAEYQGVLYLATADGLYAMDAMQDEDGDVVWVFRTGLSHLGSDALKRVTRANLLARIEGDTVFKVGSSRHGTKQERSYRLPPMTRENYRDGVVKTGRGDQSVYWEFSATGIAPAEIDQLRLDVEPLSRRR